MRPYYSAAGDVVTTTRRRRRDVIATTTAICDALRAHDGVRSHPRGGFHRGTFRLSGVRARECRRGQRAIGIDHAADHDGALARSSAELTSHPENCGLTELAATPLARAPPRPSSPTPPTPLDYPSTPPAFPRLHPRSYPRLVRSTPLPREGAPRLPLFDHRHSPTLSRGGLPPPPRPPTPRHSPPSPRAAGIPAAAPVSRKRLDRVRRATSRSDFALPTAPRSDA